MATRNTQRAASAPASDASATTDSDRVKVFVRIRPLLHAADVAAVTVDTTTYKHLSFDADVDRHQPARWHFDQVFPIHTSNRDVFLTAAKPLVHACMTGFNGTLMCYGQTGSGKTTTLSSSSDSIIPASVRYLFRQIAQSKRYLYRLSLSYIQVYNDKVYDLLASSGEALPLREHPKRGVYVDGLIELPVRTPEQVFSAIELGRSRLVVAETKMNRQSSRSHAICSITIERCCVPPAAPRPLSQSRKSSQTFIGSTSSLQSADSQASLDGAVDEDASIHLLQQRVVDTFPEQDTIMRGKLTLCDLAGSERIKKTQASGHQLQEAKDINGSLLALGNVIQALSEQRQHIPYRNSTLTRLLQESLGGNCVTNLVICLSPLPRDLSETKSTLLFGSKAMTVQMDATVNVEVDHKQLAVQLLQDIKSKEELWRRKEEELERQLAELRLDTYTQPEMLQEQYASLLDNFEAMVSAWADVSTAGARDIIAEELVGLDKLQTISRLLQTSPHALNQIAEPLTDLLESHYHGHAPLSVTSFDFANSIGVFQQTLAQVTIDHERVLLSALQSIVGDLAVDGTAPSLTEQLQHHAHLLAQESRQAEPDVPAEETVQRHLSLLRHILLLKNLSLCSLVSTLFAPVAPPPPTPHMDQFTFTSPTTAFVPKRSQQHSPLRRRRQLTATSPVDCTLSDAGSTPHSVYHSVTSLGSASTDEPQHSDHGLQLIKAAGVAAGGGQHLHRHQANAKVAKPRICNECCIS
ncbi:hypothetical protein RI367_006759 [Sorochytrium milnesiophthora]